MKQDIKTPFQALIYAEFGADELNVYKKFSRKTKHAYMIGYDRTKTKKESPSEWLARREKGLKINDKVGKRVDVEFDSSELEYYNNLNSKDKVSYSAYMRLRIEADKEITNRDAPSEWHKRYLAGTGCKVERKRGPYVKRCKNRRVAITAFVKELANRFSYDETAYFLNMINFGRKYYRRHYLANLRAGYTIKKPSEWYDEFIVSTQCREMKQLENRFFALVKREISRQHAKEYIAYFEAMAYQKERNYRL